MSERLICHDRAEIRATDADVHDIANPLSRMALPSAVSESIGKVRHAIKHRMDLGHHVLTFHKEGSLPRRAQSHMQHRSLLGGVDPLPVEHGVDSLPQPGLRCQLEEKLERLFGDSVFRIIQIQVRCLQNHPLTACWVLSEQFAQMQSAHLIEVRSQGLPRLALGQRLNFCCHHLLSVVLNC